MNKEEIKNKINTMFAGHSQESIDKWWKRPRALLDGKTPEETFENDPERLLKLVEAIGV